MSALPICCVTGRIAGDPNACGDCDPCIMGEHLVPDEVKTVLKERDEWADKYAGAMMELDEYQAASRALLESETIKNVCGWYAEIEAFRQIERR